MAERLQGWRIALLAADGAGQIELDASSEAVRRAGARTELLSLRAGQIESLDEDLDPASTYTVERTVSHATVDQYDALLLVPGVVNPHQLSSDDIVVAFVGDFIDSGKPVAVVCHGAWTLLEAGVARGRTIPSCLRMRALRKTGAAVLDGGLISSQVLRAFYSTIVEEFARLAAQAVAASGEETEHPWDRLAVFPAR